MKKSLISCAILGLALSGCGGGGGSSSATNGDGEVLSGVTTGFVLPTEISAVPAESSTTTGIQINSFASVIQALTVEQLPATSDYKKATTRKYIEERELEQFEIIEQIMSAVSQTNYADSANINAGPYKAMIAWTDEQDGREIKTLEPWVVESRMIVENGQDVNRLLAWIEEPDFDNPGQVRLIKAEFKIYTSANVNADGSFADYGEWDINVSFDATGTKFFAANSRIANGVNTIKIHEKGTGGSDSTETKGVLVRSGTAGSGKVEYPDWEWCWQNATGPGCTPPVKTAQYAYNTDYIVVDGDIDTNGTTDAVYKDRDPDNAVEMTHRYGLFYADADSVNGIAAGDSLGKHKSFGFPLRFTNATYGYEEHAYYGAWQGRHEIWGGQDLSAGDTVTKENHDPNVTAPTYVVSEKFNGILTKRTLADANLDDIKNIPVETWVNKHYDLFYDGVTDNEWKSCAGYMDWWTDPQNPTCHSFTDGNIISFTAFSDFGSLVVSQNDRKWVNVGRWDDQAQQPVNYVYLASDPSIQGFTFAGAGFYEADFGQNGGMVAKTPAALYTPTDGDNMWIDIGGSIYIVYTGNFTSPNTGWVKKALQEFNQQTWTPVFDPSGDTAFNPELGREYYINSNGANFIVKRRDAADAIASYEAKIELQAAANPVNYNTILPTGTSYLATPWRPEVAYTFVTTPGSNFMKLVYLTDDPNTQEVDESAVTTVVTTGEWGLQAYNSSNQPLKADGTVVAVDEYGIPTDPTVRPVEFNWEYSGSGEGWGVQQFLCTPDCSVASNYVMLSDPVQLESFTATNGAGDTKNLSLMYDGWMHGLPDMYFELSKNDWQMSQDISDKIINIPEGTLVTDLGGVDFYIKPLEVSVFLGVVASNTAGVPDISDADAVDLSTVPDFTPHGMGAKPTGTVVKYSEGILVE